MGWLFLGHRWLLEVGLHGGCIWCPVSISPMVRIISRVEKWGGVWGGEWGKRKMMVIRRWQR